MTTAKLACPCNRTWFGHSPATQHDDTARRVALRCAQPTMKRPSTVSAASEVVIAQHAEVVIAHCSMDLAWLRHGLGRLEAQGAILVRRVSVYSKCGKPVINASADWEVHELPNVGRNDHTYAHHIATSHGCLQPTVFFFKDRQAAGWSQMKDRARRSSRSHGTARAEHRLRVWLPSIQQGLRRFPQGRARVPYVFVPNVVAQPAGSQAQRRGALH